MSENVRLQDLREFTAQIRDPDNDIVGTGIVIEPNRVITCAHVIEAAVGKAPRDVGDSAVVVYLPKYGARVPISRHAIVDCCLAGHDDDIVCLKLIDGPVPLGPEQFAELGSAEQSEGHLFRSYGYSPTGEYPATRAEGHIRGSVEPPEGKVFLVDPVQLSSQEIDRGMSGSAVLDIERNLVVGLVSERYFPDGWIKGNISYAVDNIVLTFNPFFFSLHEKPYPLRPAPKIRIDKDEARAAIAEDTGLAWNNAPSPLIEWVGREDLLKSIINDWVDSNKHVIGLIGFGGEGKSSLARRWVDELLNMDDLPQPDGLFWWGFYDRQNVDEFLEAALKYLSGSKIDPSKIPSTNIRSQIISAMLGTGRYLFILDGLEVLQYQEGDQYGSLKSQDLKTFLEFFGAPDHNSFCIVTSRAPLMDMEDYITYQHKDVDRLSLNDGCTLLHKLGVKGNDSELERVVSDWDGHALTLSLLASYLSECYDGDISYINNIRAPTADEPRYKRINRILRRYDNYLTDEERAFLFVFSAFRIPVKNTAFDLIFRRQIKFCTINESLIILSQDDLCSITDHLIKIRVLRYNAESGEYTLHPLIKSYYHSQLNEMSLLEIRSLHNSISDYYAYIGNTPEAALEPALDDLRSFIEAVHHACEAGNYDKANRIFWGSIQKEGKFILSRKIGAWETERNILEEFFPNSDLSKDPMIDDPSWKNVILNEIGLCYVYLGRLKESQQYSFYERSIKISRSIDELHTASVTYQNLTELLVFLGNLESAEEAAVNGVLMAENISSCYFQLPPYLENAKRIELLRSKAGRAWVAYLKGEFKIADAFYHDAKELDEYKRLYFLRGIQYADYQRRLGNIDYAITRPLHDRLILLLFRGTIIPNAIFDGLLPFGGKKLFKVSPYGLKRLNYFLRIS